MQKILGLDLLSNLEWARSVCRTSPRPLGHFRLSLWCRLSYLQTGTRRSAHIGHRSHFGSRYHIDLPHGDHFFRVGLGVGWGGKKRLREKAGVCPKISSVGTGEGCSKASQQRLRKEPSLSAERSAMYKIHIERVTRPGARVNYSWK